MDEGDRNMRRRTLLKSALGVGLASASGSVLAQTKKYGPGASDTEILIGNTVPYSGPASSYGSIGKTFSAYFQMVNEQGGVNGRKIKLISLDDAFSPPKTVEQVRRLIEQEEVLFMFGMAGSSPVLAVQKYLEARKVPNVFIASGATRWGDYKNFPWSMGFNVNYTVEGMAYAQYLLRDKPNVKVAVLYQNDEFGKDTYAGFKAGLGDKAKRMIVAEQSYELTDPTIDSQLISLHGSGADTFINLSTPKFAAMAIRKVSQMGWKPTHIITSNSASIGTVLMPAGLENSVGLISFSAYKDPTNPQWTNDPGVVEWRAFMKKYYPEASVDDGVNLSSAMFAKALVQVLEQCGDELTRENVMRQAANIKDLSLPGLLPGVKINTSPTDYNPIEQGQLMRFDGKHWIMFGDLLGRG